MKKGLLGLLLVLVVGFVIFYVTATPSAITQNIIVETSPNTIFRCFTDGRLVQNWWAGDSGKVVTTAPKSLQFADDGLTYTVTPRPFNVIDVVVQDAGKPVQTFITMLPLQGDSVDVVWKADLSAGGIFAKLQNAGRTRRLKHNMANVLQRMHAFMQSERNLYGFAVQRMRVTDTLLVVTKLLDTTPPTVETYYGLIKKLREYIARLGVQETNYPMLNISQPDSAHYQTMVAIPINKSVPDAGAIVEKRMIPGNILVAEVKGGPGTIRAGFRQLDTYAAEHRFTQPGLSFQSLVTDRLAERDTTRWITKLYYPVQ